MILKKEIVIIISSTALGWPWPPPKKEIWIKKFSLHVIGTYCSWILAACWDPFREVQITVLRRVQEKTAQFTNHTKDSDWETLAQRRTIERLCALFKATLGDGLGKLYATGCEGFTIWVGLIMFGKLGTRSKERIMGSIPL